MYNDSQSDNRPAGRRLHCPQCRSTEISPIVESEITGGTSLNHSISRKNSVSGMKFNNVHRNYWMCSNCGHKFRNIQSLEEELAGLKKSTKTICVGVILSAILAVLLGIGGGPIAFGLGLGIVGFALIGYFVSKGKCNNLQKEQEYLKENCFN